MNWELAGVVAVIGLGAGFVSGLLGIGGGIVMAPALLYLPPLLHVGELDMRTVAGLTIVQALAACLFAGARHNRYGFVSKRLVLVMGPTMMVAALIGGLGSGWMSNEVLVAVFAVLALAAAGLMLIPQRDEESQVDPDLVDFSRPLAVLLAGTVGFLGGMVGQGGSFLLIPLMLLVLKLPTKVAVGSNLGVVLFSSLAGFVGKAVTGQIVYPLAVALVVGTIPGSQLGSLVSKGTPPKVLRFGLAAAAGLTAARMFLAPH